MANDDKELILPVNGETRALVNKGQVAKLNIEGVDSGAVYVLRTEENEFLYIFDSQDTRNAVEALAEQSANDKDAKSWLTGATVENVSKYEGFENPAQFLREKGYDVADDVDNLVFVQGKEGQSPKYDNLLDSLGGITQGLRELHLGPATKLANIVGGTLTLYKALDAAAGFLGKEGDDKAGNKPTLWERLTGKAKSDKASGQAGDESEANEEIDTPSSAGEVVVQNTGNGTTSDSDLVEDEREEGRRKLAVTDHTNDIDKLLDMQDEPDGALVAPLDGVDKVIDPNKYR